MEQRIEHSFLDIRGLKLHVAHTGHGELGTVVFLHGFPEIWYSWRYQMIAVADAGFRAIAPDFRGYGLSDQPPEPEKASWEDLIADLLAILDSLSIAKAFIVAKDFGALPAYHFAILHPERVQGMVILGIPFRTHRDPLPSGFYFVRWQEPGRAEADFRRFDVKTVVRNIYILFSGSELQVAAEDQEIMDLVDPSTPLPPWFKDEDLTVYAMLYEKSGFHFPMLIPYMVTFPAGNPMLASSRKWSKLSNVTSHIKDLKVPVPVLLIMGEKDYVLKIPGLEDSIKSGMVKEYIPDLEITFLPEGTHFVQEQLPEQVNKLIITFLGKIPVEISDL